MGNRIPEKGTVKRSVDIHQWRAEYPCIRSRFNDREQKLKGELIGLQREKNRMGPLIRLNPF